MKFPLTRQIALRSALALIGMLLMAQSHAHHDCRYRVAYEQSQLFHASDANGNVIGIDADILKEVMQSMDCRLSFKSVPWARALAWIKSGRLDIAIGASYTQEREDFVHYSLPYRGQPHLIARYKGGKSTEGDLEHFLAKGNILGVVNGWHYTDKIQTLITNTKYLDYIRYTHSFDLLPTLHKKGKIAAFLAYPSQLLEHGYSRKDLIQQYQFEKVDVDRLHYIFSRRNIKQSKVEEFNRLLKRKLDEGILGKTCRRYRQYMVGGCEFFALEK